MPQTAASTFRPADGGESIGTEIDWYAADEHVFVTPRSKSRFRIDKDRAIKVLQGDRETGLQIVALVERLARWISEFEPNIDAAFLTTQDSTLLFAIVTRGVEWDEDLCDKLIDLKLEIAVDDHFNKTPLAVICIPHCPPESYVGFLGSEFCWRFHRGPKPPRKGKVAK
jgi:hypothetical protein